MLQWISLDQTEDSVFTVYHQINSAYPFASTVTLYTLCVYTWERLYMCIPYVVSRGVAILFKQTTNVQELVKIYKTWFSKKQILGKFHNYLLHLQVYFQFTPFSNSYNSCELYQMVVFLLIYIINTFHQVPSEVSINLLDENATKIFFRVHQNRNVSVV